MDLHLVDSCLDYKLCIPCQYNEDKSTVIGLVLSCSKPYHS